MAFYADKHLLMDGAVLLYRRQSKDGVIHANWQARFKLPGRSGYPQIVSCKTTNYEQAVALAMERFHDIHHKAKHGQPLKDWTFADHWTDWFNRRPMSEHRKRLHRHFYNRYFKEYFGPKLLSEITPEFAENYWPWRRSYWSNHQRLIKYNPRRKGAKTTGTNNAKETPANKTLAMERQALNQIFSDACQRNRMTLLRLDKPYTGDTDEPRWGFDDDEWHELEMFLADWAATGLNPNGDQARLNGYLRQRRRQFYCFVIFMVSTGLRPGEAKEMRWGDITVMPDHVQIRIPKHQTKRRKARTVVSMPAGRNAVLLWKGWTATSNPQDYVWQGQGNDGENIKSDTFTDTFQNLLRQIPYHDRPEGLLLDPDGKPRVVYSLRHTYATQRLLHGELRIDQLADNMGTSVAMIQKHYSHVTNIQNTAHHISDKRSLEERSKGAFLDSSRVAVGANIAALRRVFEPLPSLEDRMAGLVPPDRDEE